LLRKTIQDARARFVDDALKTRGIKDLYV